METPWLIAAVFAAGMLVCLLLLLNGFQWFRLRDQQKFYEGRLEEKQQEHVERVEKLEAAHADRIKGIGQQLRHAKKRETD